MTSKTPGRLPYLLLANGLILLTVVYAGVLESRFEDFYFVSIQEDEYMEWATVWAFLFSGVAAFIVARRHRASTGQFPWYFYGLGLFCVLVAMEEFSWGQRIFGYRPPVYFLEHNYQQELNIHNVIDSGVRKLVLSWTILGYGVLLPVLGYFRTTGDLLKRSGVVPATVWLIPAFLATYVLYEVYPWGHSGEWVELMLGGSILFSLLPMLQRTEAAGNASAAKLPAWVVASWAGVIVLGSLSGAASRAQRDVHPDILKAAQNEVEAIKRDFESGRVKISCSKHKRLYTYMVQYGEDGLLRGEFARLQNQGLPPERADYFLDPWNSPYWIRDRCDRRTGRRHVFVYSFGPDRNRDSTDKEILGDDIGAYINLR